MSAHKSQYAVLHARSIVNQDNVYWIRRTDNLLNKATVVSSMDDNSGDEEIEKIRDFKILDTDDLITKDPRKIDYSTACCKFVSGSRLKAQWNSEITCDRFVFHGSVNIPERQDVDIELSADRNAIGGIKQLEPYGRDTVLVFPEITVTELEIRFNCDIELSEIEVFRGETILPDICCSYDHIKDTENSNINGLRGTIVDFVDTVGYKMIVIATRIRRKLTKIRAH